MSSVDNRIVEMEFDNKQFQKGVTKTINSIDELKKSLQFNGVEKGFEKIEKGFKDIDPSAVGKAIDAVTNKFSVLGTMADQAIRRITDQMTGKLLNALKETLNLLTGIGYSMDGFKEYELKIGSIQTIAANTGALSKNIQNDAKEVIKLTEEEEKVAQDVIKGLYGVDAERRRLLEAAGYDYTRIQSRVNDIMSGVNSNVDEVGKKTKTTLADIDAALDDLNLYADKTIYSFSQMTQAVGRFTTAGIDLETSTEAIKGISNLAALSGSTNAQLQSAMYNMSQAMQKGSMQLLDWRSIENAGMASQMFKDAVIETARVHGVAIDQMIKDEGSFNETLKKGWFTNDILIESLAKLTAFTDDMTEEERKAERARWKEIGYTDEQISAIEDLSRVAYESATKVRTFSQLVGTLKEEVGSSYSMMWQNIVGNFDEATELWTGLHDAIQNNFITPMSKARDEKWKFFHDNGGRAAAIEGLTNVGKGLLTIIHAIGDAWHEVFPRDDGRRITALAKGFAEFSKRLVVSDETAKKIKLTFQGLFSIVHIFTTAIKLAAKIIGLFIKALGKLSGTEHPILSLTAKIGELLIELDKFLTSSDTIEAVVDGITWAFNKLAEVLGIVVDKMKYFVEEVAAPKLLNVFEKAKNGIHDFVIKSKKDVDSLDDNENQNGTAETEEVKSRWKRIAEALANAFDKVKDVVEKVWGWLKNAFITTKNLIVSSGGNISLGTVIEALVGFEAFTAFRSLKKFLNNASKTFEGITDILDGVKDVLAAYALQIKANVLMTIAKATLMLVGAIIAMSFIDSNKLWAAVGAMTGLMAALTIMTVVIAKMSDSLNVIKANVGGKLGLSTDIGQVLMHIAEAILVMVAAVAILSFIDTKRMANGMAALAFIMIMLGIFVMSVTEMTRVSNAKAIASAAAVIFATGVALAAMLVPILVLSFLPTDRVADATKSILMVMGALTIIIGLITKFTREGDPKNLLAASVLLIAISLAIEALLIPLVVLAFIPQDKLATAAAVMGVLIIALGFMIGAMALMAKETDASKILSISTVILALTAAIVALLPAAIIFGLLPINALLKAGAALVVIIVAIIATIKAIPEKSGGRAKVLASLALAIFAIATSLMMLIPFNWKQLLVAAGSMALVVASFGIIFTTMGKKNPDKIAKAMKAICAMVITLAAALLALSTVPPDELGLYAVIFAALLGVIVAISKFAGTGIIMLGEGFALIGAGAALAGIGVLALVAAFEKLQDIDTAIIGIKLLELLAGIGLAIQNAAPIIISVMAVIISEIIKNIAKAAVTIIGAIKDVIVALCDALIELTPKLAQTIITVIFGVVDVIIENMGGIVDRIFRFLISLFNALGEWLADIDNSKRLVDSIMTFLDGLVTLILTTIVTLFKELLWDECIKPVCDFFYDFGGDVINSIIEGLKSAWHSVQKWFEDKVSWVMNKVKKITSAMDELNKKIFGVAYGNNKNAAAAYSISGILGTSSDVILEDMDEGESWKAYLDNIAETGNEIQKQRIHAYYQIIKAFRNIYGGLEYGYDIEGRAFDVGQMLNVSGNNLRFDVDEYDNLIASYMDANGQVFEYNLGQNLVTDKILAEYQGKSYEMAYKAGKSAGEATADGLTKGFKEAADIHSPAKSDEITSLGKNYVEGIGNGAEDASDDVGSKIVSTLTGAVSKFGDKFKGSYDISSMFNTDDMISGIDSEIPSTTQITPVMNMDTLTSPNIVGNVDLEGDGATLYSKGIKGNIDLSGSDELTKNLAIGVSDEMDKYQQAMIETTNAIYEEVASLRDYISELKIQLDTNALVGSLVGPMDTALGQRANAKSRGV